MAVIRVDHHKNYVVINKQVLEDPNLSFKAKGIWAYCMSRPNDWTFHVSHLATVSKEGEDAIYSGLKELEKEGYLWKEQKNENGKFGKFDYIISEVKKSLPHRDFPVAGFPLAENQVLLSNDLNQVSKEDLSCPNSSSSPPSPDGSEELASYLFEKIKEFKSNFKAPNLKKWSEDIRRMLKVDKRTVEEIRSVIDYATSDPFWRTNILSAEKLRLQFDTLQIKAKATESERNKLENLQFASQARARFPERLKALKISGGMVINLSNSKDVSLYMRPELFQDLFKKIFN